MLEHREHVLYRDVQLDADNIDRGAKGEEPAHIVELMNVRHSKNLHFSNIPEQN